MNYFWSTQTLRREPFFPLQYGDRIPLHFLASPEKIITVESATHTVVYENPGDYTIDLETNTLQLPPNSRITPIPESDLVRPHGSANAYRATRDEQNSLLWSEEGLFHEHLLLISYESRDGPGKLATTVDAMRQASEGTLPRFRDSMQSGGLSHILLFGDSISAGSNASRTMNLPPRQPAFGELFVSHLEGSYPGSPISFRNTSEGGRDSEWGRRVFKSIFKNDPGQVPDLVILGWGMNDSSGRRPPKRFLKNLARQVKFARACNPACEFIVISSMLPNPAWSAAHSDYILRYRELLRSWVKQEFPDILLVDMSAIWEVLLRKKAYYDLTGNGLNHPNDFGHQIYAEVLDYLIS